MTKLVKITTNNQIAIPSFAVKSLKLHRGSYLEVETKNNKIVLTPKKLVNAEDFALYEEIIRKGRAEASQGKTVSWESVKKKLKKT